LKRTETIPRKEGRTMKDAERMIIIRALALNCRENAKNGADEDNRPLLDLIHELAFQMDVEYTNFSLGE